LASFVWHTKWRFRPVASGGPSLLSTGLGTLDHTLLKIKVRIYGREFLALVDSGATHNFLSRQLAERLRLPVKAGNQAACFANGESSELAGECSVLVTSAVFKEVVHFAVITLNHPVILGKPWLTKINPKIDWATNSMHLRQMEAASAEIMEKEEEKKGMKDSETPVRAPEIAEIMEEESEKVEVKKPETPRKPETPVRTPEIAEIVKKEAEKEKVRKPETPKKPETPVRIQERAENARKEAEKDVKKPETPVRSQEAEEKREEKREKAEAPARTQEVKEVREERRSQGEGIQEEKENEEPRKTEETSETEESLFMTGKEFKRALRRKEECFVAVIQSVDPQATTQEQQQDPRITALLEEYEDVFCEELPPVLPPKRDIVHTIPIDPDAQPPARPPYRLSMEEEAELEKQVRTLLEKGFIRPSTSPYAAPVLFVKKADGKLRLCVDYRKVNAQTVRNSYPLPRIDGILERIHGSRVFSKLDLASGYHQIRIADDDIPKTAFTTRKGLFEFTVLPFGLTGAPATFMRVINEAFRDLIDESLQVYLDDLLTHSKTIDEHVTHLRQVLDILRKNKLYAKRSKCVFGVKEVEFLGHTISAGGISPKDDKTEAIRAWPRPKNTPELRSFLGLCNFYHRFVRNYATMAAPLTSLTGKGKQFVWTHQAQEAFDHLKTAISSAPLLLPINPAREFVIHTDASNVGVGAVLSQEDEEGDLRPTAFASRKLTPTEQKWPTHDKELAAVLHALETWSHLVKGRAPQVLVDNSSVRYFEGKPKISERQTRWLDRIAEFQPQISYLKGKHNAVADALSRHPLHLGAISTVQVPDELLQEFRDALKGDPRTDVLVKLKSYTTKEGLLYHKDQLYVPDSRTLRTKLLQAYHDSPLGGHFAVEKTLEKLRRDFFWPEMERELKEYVRSCDQCQRTKPSNQQPAGLLHPLPIPSRNWESVSMDFLTGLPKTQRGKDAIFVVVDRLSKMCHLCPTTKDASAPDIARLFFSDIFRLHGMPTSIVSDRDAKFTSNFWKALFDLCGVDLRLSSAYHPQTDGQTERTNRTLEQVLRNYINHRQDDWDLHLTPAEFAINDSKQSSTGFSPFFLNANQHPVTPQALINPRDTPVPAANDHARTFSENTKLARENLVAAQERQKRFADNNRKEEELNVGDRVLISTKNLTLAFQTGRDAAKLDHRWAGPFKVLEKNSAVSYKVELPPEVRVHPVFHISVLKPYHEAANERFPNRNHARPPPVIIDEEEEYEIEGILAHETKYGKTRYLVKWKGYPLSDASMLPESSFKNAQDILQAYLRGVNGGV